ncbi:hypothetical protein Tco_0319621 [Tanacetum coccineum]
MKETPYELLEDDQKKKLGKKNEAKMTLYNALPRKNGFTRFNDAVTSLESLDPDYSSKNHVRKFLRALPLKWRAKVKGSKTTKEKVKSLALKAKVTREQTSDDSDSQEGSDKDIDEEEAEAFNLLARNFRKFFRKGNQFGHGNRFGNGANSLEEAAEIALVTKVVKARSKKERVIIAG